MHTLLPNFGVHWGPLAAGLVCIALLALSYVSWDFQTFGKKTPFTFKLKAFAPLLTSVVLLVSLAFAGKAPGRAMPPAILYVGAPVLGAILYLLSDFVMRRLLRSPFYRPSGGSWNDPAVSAYEAAASDAGQQQSHG